MQQFSDKIHWYYDELTSQVIAESGIPSDRFHFGKILLRCLKDTPDFISQIDGGTGEEETNKSVLERTVKCASSFKNFGVKYQDVIIVMAPNHLHICIPLYAAFCTGVVFAGIDVTLGQHELADTLKSIQPKMIFCQSAHLQTVRNALELIKGNTEVVTFDEGQDCMNFTEFISKYSGNTTIDNFRAEDFDAVNAEAMLVTTSGSTGIPKAATLTHRNISIGFPLIGEGFLKFPTPFDVGFVISPIQWITATYQIIMSPIMKYTRLQTSAPLTTGHVYSLINKYKPSYTICSPTYLMTLLKSDQSRTSDFTSFKYMLVGGSAVSKSLYTYLKKVIPNAAIQIGYGMSETTGVIFNSFYVPIGSVGRPRGHMDWKLVDTETEEQILEPNKSGELRLKGPAIFKGYYNNPEMSAEAFDKDGWFKSGDIFYRDEYYNFFFVDRLKMLLKYRNNQVSPMEIESVILKHPGVLDVAVSGVPDEEFGDLPVAFVVKKDGYEIDAQDIQDIVKETLSDSKQLRGGVVFLKGLPLTTTLKMDRKKIKNMAMNLKKNLT